MIDFSDKENVNKDLPLEAYGKLQAGLFYSVVRDTIERLDIKPTAVEQPESDSPSPLPRTRKQLLEATLSKPFHEIKLDPVRYI